MKGAHDRTGNSPCGHGAESENKQGHGLDLRVVKKCAIDHRKVAPVQKALDVMVDCILRALRTTAGDDCSSAANVVCIAGRDSTIHCALVCFGEGCHVVAPFG